MVFTKREKIILAATIAVLGLLVVDVYVLTPLLDERAAVGLRKDRLTAQMIQARSLRKRGELLGQRWRRMLADGMKHDPAEAESLLLRSLRDWCADVGVRLSSLRPERSAEKSALPEITVDVTGTGSMGAVARLLWRVETAGIPAKVKMVQIGSRKDGTDDLSLHLKVSTLYSPAGPASPERLAGGRGSARGAK